MEPTSTQNPTPAPEQTLNTKLILAVIVVIALLALGYFLSLKYNPEKGSPEGTNETTPMEVVVEHTQAVNGVLPAPKGFPTDIPIEKFGIIESAVTDFPTSNARQLTLSYRSKKTVALKYAEYKDYITKAGYTLSEGGTGPNLKYASGVKGDVSLSVVVSAAEGGSLVQIAYLLKSVK